MYENHFQRKYSREPPILGWSTFIGFVAAVVQTVIAICGRSHGHENIALAYFPAVNLFTYVVNSVDKCIARKTIHAVTGFLKYFYIFSPLPVELQQQPLLCGLLWIINAANVRIKTGTFAVQ